MRSACEYRYNSSQLRSGAGRISFNRPTCLGRVDLHSPPFFSSFFFGVSSGAYYCCQICCYFFDNVALNSGLLVTNWTTSATSPVLTYLSSSERVYSMSPLGSSRLEYTLREGLALTSSSQTCQLSSIRMSRPRTWKQRGFPWSAFTKQW